METSALRDPAAPAAPEPGNLTPLARAVAIFVRPSQAWVGLRDRAQWWLPMLVVLVVAVLGSVLIYQRAQLPTMLQAMEDQVANGQMTAEQVQRIEDFYGSPAGVAVTVGAGTVWIAVLTFLMALLVWFGVGFVLGSPFRYRHALEVTTWSSLVTLPPTALTMVLAWIRQSLRGLHVGFGILLPEVDPPSKLLTSLGVFLDWIGPFGIWHVAVAVLGAAYLSGAPRKSVAWVLGALYVAAGLFAAGLTALMARGA
ncbi:MAG TPA: YIP1 family protein [Candidatus Eisenbacteria bacterium]|jgi:hypothetical protein